MALTAMGAQPIVDTDQHVTETIDIWTARVSKKYRDVAPRVETNPKTGRRQWRIGDKWYWTVAGGFVSQAGWPEHPPSAPVEFDEIDTAMYDAHDRLKRLDSYGIDAAILYPNLVGFAANAVVALGAEAANDMVRAYNDYMHEWASADPQRLFPMAMMPFWDMDATCMEIDRCVNLGFKGLLFANKLENIGYPQFLDRHWDPLYARAQDYDIPVNYHIGFDLDSFHEEENVSLIREGDQIDTPLILANSLMANANQIGRIVMSDICERFPRLKLVHVETGFGQYPYYLESLDWYWEVYGLAETLPDRKFPSEYFRRQCYGTHWHERTPESVFEQVADNFMFSTDYPHITSLGPGPAGGTTLTPAEYALEVYGGWSPELRDKALYKNACEVYKIDLHKRDQDTSLDTVGA